MVGQGRSKVFLIVTIPTHLRVMLQTAELLQACGRYHAQVIYYPANVFHQNAENCSAAPFDAFLWTGEGFLPRARGLPQNVPAADGQKAVPSVELPNETEHSPSTLFLMRVYKSLLRICPILPSVDSSFLKGRYAKKIVRSSIESVINNVLIPFARACAHAFGVLLMIYRFLYAELRRKETNVLKSTSGGRSGLQRMFLRSFEATWKEGWSDIQGGSATVRRLRTAFREGLLSGVEDQKRFYLKFEELLAAEKPVLVILPEENLFYNSHLVVHAALASGIRSIVVPFTIVNTLEWAEAFYGLQRFHADFGWNRVIAKAFPNWVLEHRGRRLILPPTYVVGCEYLGAVPEHPWVINSGHALAIASESPFMSSYYQRAGIPCDKVRLTGTLADDRLFMLLQNQEQERKALENRWNLKLRGKIFLVGLPPDQFGGEKRNGCEFASYEELIRFMIGTIASHCSRSNTLLINLHPRINPAEVAYLEEYGARIIAEPIETLVPLVDVYVAVVSATIRLAMSCGVPVLNYDAYQYDYDDYKELSGVVEIKTKDGYRETVAALADDESFFSKMQVAQQETARLFGIVDGNAGKRLLALVDDIASS
jgi:hypothetical protein